MVTCVTRLVLTTVSSPVLDFTECLSAPEIRKWNMFSGVTHLLLTTITYYLLVKSEQIKWLQCHSSFAHHLPQFRKRPRLYCPSSAIFLVASECMSAPEIQGINWVLFDHYYFPDQFLLMYFSGMHVSSRNREKELRFRAPNIIAYVSKCSPQSSPHIVLFTGSDINLLQRREQRRQAWRGVVHSLEW